MTLEFVIDAETESLEDIGLGAYSYCIHPSTDVLCFSWRLLRGKPGTERVWFPGKRINPAYLLHKMFRFKSAGPRVFVPGSFEVPPELKKAIEEDAIFYAHNAFFEQCWWKLVMSKKYGWPEIRPEQWRCSAAQSAYHGFSQSLERACLGVGTEIAKDLEGSALMKKMSPIGKRTKKILDNWDENLFRLGQYCKTDVASEADLIMSLPPLPENEQKIWLLDQKINFTGIPIDRELVEAGARSSDLLDIEARKKLPVLTDGKVIKPGEIARIQKWVEDRTGRKLPNLQAPTVEQLIKNPLTPANVAEVLKIRQDSGSAAIKKYTKAAETIRHDPTSRFRGGNTYYGTHTGRWAGRVVQPANMPRAHFKTDEQTENAIKAIKSGSLEEMEKADV